MSAKDALTRITARIGNERDARRILDQAALNGALHIRGTTVVTELDVGPIRLSPPKSARGLVQKVLNPAEGKYTHLNIGTWGCNRSTYLPKLLLWEEAIFVLVDPPLGRVTRHKSGRYTEPARTRRVIYEIEVQGRQIEELARSLAAPKLSMPRDAVVEWDFSDVRSELEAAILCGDIHRFGRADKRGTQAKLEKYICERMATSDGLEPGESTVRRAAKDLMLFWRAHVASKQA